MKNNISSLSQNELMIMEVIWNSSEPLTCIDIAEFIKEWKSSYLNNLLSSLQKKGMIEMVGVVQCGNHYVRQFTSTYTKEQYVAKMITSININKKSIPKITVALMEELSGEEYEEISDDLENLLNACDKKKGIIE